MENKRKAIDTNFTIETNKRRRETSSKKTIRKPIKKNMRGTLQEDIEFIKRRIGEEKPEILKSSPSTSDYNIEQQEEKNFNENDVKVDMNIQAKSSFSTAQCIEWTDVDYITEFNNVDRYIAENVVKLFNEDNTIPFIARYRKSMTGSMEPEQLRALKNDFDQVKIIKHRATTIIKAIDKIGKWSAEIHSIITSIKSLDDLEHIYSLFKQTKRSLAEKARILGLGSISNAILLGQKTSPLASLVNKEKEGLQTEEQVRDGIVHLIADHISKDKEIFNRIIFFQKRFIIEIETMQYKSLKNSKDKPNDIEEQKYEIYFNFKTNVKNIKSHQILAINRGESRKILNVKIILSNAFEEAFKNFCLSRYRLVTQLHQDLLNNSIDYAYKKLIKPLVIRRIRTEMKTKAEIASIEVFATNLKQLLLSPPIRGKIILGIDPGFYHGCKLAVISEHGDVLDTAVIYPHKNLEAAHKRSVDVLVDLINKHKCTILALGNATACRETELFLTKIIKAFRSLDLTYTIVNESGSSIYSCSSEAQSEFPNLDPNLISAISIARRLQDPLAELVKVEPKHLGVGMYQHDLPDKQLLSTLDEVVTEAVSFVGVDINTASECLLKKVAGLTQRKAANIIEWRTKHGTFKNREQLLNVNGIGSKTFKQCAGFIRVLPETAILNKTLLKEKESKHSKDDLNLLDQTWIHPESYTIANQFLKDCQCDLKDLGTPEFIERIKCYVKNRCADLAKQFKSNEATIEIIIKSLTMRKDEDIRSKSNYPLFCSNVRSISDLHIGTILTGVVRNITHFGAFVDVGVGTNGLIHIKYFKNHTLHVSQRVEVKILSIEHDRNRISLELINIL